MIQLGRRGVTLTASTAELDTLRAQYDRNNYLILHKLIEPELLEKLVKSVESARFLPRDHDGIGTELCMADPAPKTALLFLASNPAFLRIVEKITGCPRLGSFSGRVYRMTATDGHYDSWHSDFCDGRMAAMSLNLTRETYRGGALQMKNRSADDVLCEIHNTGFGDAVLFRIAKDLVHRVRGVEGEVPKTAFAGWFQEGADWLSSLQKTAHATDRP